MKKILIFFFVLISAGIQAQNFTFECFCQSTMTGDSCDICPGTSISSRSFSGLLIYRNGVKYKWIDEPYMVRLRPDENVEFLEQGPNADKVTIALYQTPYTTIAGFLDSTFCQCGDFRALWYASDSTSIGPIYPGDTLAITGWGATTVTYDALLKKYVIYTPVSGGGGGSGTVTNFSFTDGNGFDGTVTNPTTTPNLTLATTITGVIYGASGALNAVTVGAGLNFSAPTLTAIDQSATNELQTLANTSDATSHTATLSNSGGSVKYVEGTGIGIATTGTTLDGVVTITNTSALGTGTVNYFPKWDTGGASLTATSLMYDDGASVILGGTTANGRFNIRETSGKHVFLGEGEVKMQGPAIAHWSMRANEGGSAGLYFINTSGGDNIGQSGATEFYIKDTEVACADNFKLGSYSGGTAVSITGRDASNYLTSLNLGSGLSLSGGTLSATTYSTIQEEGTPLTQQPALNFVGSAYTASNDGANSRTNVTADADVNALANIATTGLYVVTGAGTSTTTNMNMAASTAAPGIGGSWSNANGVSGPPTLSLDFTGYTWKQYARMVSTTNITLSGLQTIDGVVGVISDRVLVTGQTTAANNGLYLMTSGVWNRAPEANASGEFTPQGQVYFVTEGTAKGNTFWYLETDNVTLGTTPLVYTQQVNGSAGGSGWLLDGNTVGSQKTLGTNDNFDLPFETNGTIRGRFSTTGDFLVNATTTGNKLNVEGLGASGVCARFNGGTLAAFNTNVLIGGNATTSVYGIDENMTVSGASNNLINRFRNGSTGSVLNQISVSSTAGGDPMQQYNVETANTWTEGIDNSDADRFKIAKTSALGVSVSDDVFVIGTDGLASIGGIAPIATTNLAVAGTGGVRVPAGTIAQRPASTESIIRHNTQNDGLEAQSSDGGWHLVTARTSPTVTTGNALGTGGTMGATINGSYTNGSITIQTGTTGLVNNGTVLTVNYPVTFSANPTMILDGANPATMNERAKFYVSNNGQANSIITANGTLTANTNYILWYIIKN